MTGPISTPRPSGAAAEVRARRPDVSTHDLLSVAAFTAGLTFVYGNRQFTRLTGRRPGDLHGRSWMDLFPGTTTDDERTILAVVAGERAGADVDLVVPYRHPAARRASDRAPRPPRECLVQPAVVHGIRPATGRAALALVAPSPGPAAPALASRVSALPSVPQAARWIEPLLANAAGQGGRLVVLALAVHPGSPGSVERVSPDDPASPLATPASVAGVTPWTLAQGLVAGFRAQDRVGVFGRRWVLLACPGVQQPAVGDLCERFRAACDRLVRPRVGGRADPGQEFVMTLADHLDHAGDVLRRLRLDRRPHPQLRPGSGAATGR